MGTPARRKRWLAAAVLGAGVLVGAAFLARQLLPLRSILGLSDGGVCFAEAERTRLPGGAPSEAGRWDLAESYPIPRDEVRAATVGSHIYVGTGIQVSGGAFRSLSELYRFDPARRRYERLPDLPERVDHAALVGHRGALYVIGGYHDDEPTASVWRLSTETGRWTALEPMRVARSSPAAAVIEDKIYVAGGSEGHRGEPRSTKFLEIYDIKSGTWTRGPDMPTARHHHGAAEIHGRLIVVGGRADDDLSVAFVDRFDPARGRWDRLAPLPLGAGGLAVVASAGMLVAIGGGDDAEAWVTPATWALDADEGGWHRLADLNVARHGHGAAAVGSEVFVFGGAPCPGYGVTDAVESLKPTAGRRSR